LKSNLAAELVQIIMEEVRTRQEELSKDDEAQAARRIA